MLKKKNFLLVLFFATQISYAQNIGMGISTPQTNLHIHSITGTTRLQLSNAFTSANSLHGGVLGIENTDFSIQNFNGNLKLGTFGATLLHLTGDLFGRVGIGSENPQAKLQISTNTDVTENEALRIQGTNNPYTTWYNNNNFHGYIQAASSSFELGSKSNYPINFYTSDAQRLTILGNGNVGIGTATPTRIFQVKGNSNILAEFNNTNTTIGSTALEAWTGNIHPGLFQILESPQAIRAVAGNGCIGVYGIGNGNSTAILGATRIGVGGGFDAMEGGIALATRVFTSNAVSAQFSALNASGFPIKSVVEFQNTAPSVARSSIPFAFQVIANGTNSITIPNDGFANAANDLIYIQHVGVAANVNTAVYTKWNGTNWIIYTESGGNIANGEVYNVMVIKQSL
jgi:hypothetical protein